MDYEDITSEGVARRARDLAEADLDAEVSAYLYAFAEVMDGATSTEPPPYEAISEALDNIATFYEMEG